MLTLTARCAAHRILPTHHFFFPSPPLPPHCMVARVGALAHGAAAVPGSSGMQPCSSAKAAGPLRSGHAAVTALRGCEVAPVLLGTRGRWLQKDDTACAPALRHRVSLSHIPHPRATSPLPPPFPICCPQALSPPHLPHIAPPSPVATPCPISRPNPCPFPVLSRVPVPCPHPVSRALSQPGPFPCPSASPTPVLCPHALPPPSHPIPSPARTPRPHSCPHLSPCPILSPPPSPVLPHPPSPLSPFHAPCPTPIPTPYPVPALCPLIPNRCPISHPHTLFPSPSPPLSHPVSPSPIRRPFPISCPFSHTAPLLGP